MNTGRSNECYEFRDYGTCRFGDSCRFEHTSGGKGDVRGESAPRGGGGGGYSGGGAYGGGGRRYGGGGGGFSRSDVCFQWRDTGSCRFGDECRFSHGDASGGATGGSGGGRGYGGGYGGYSGGGGYGGGGGFRRGGGGGVCYNWRDTGSCRFGDSCRFEHPAADSGAKEEVHVEKDKQGADQDVDVGAYGDEQ